jgi:cobalt-zinc-cadmium efflux system outer membrane protein
MRRPRKARLLAWGCASALGATFGTGCATYSPLPQGAFIREPLGPPQLPAALVKRDGLPDAPEPEVPGQQPKLAENGPLQLSEVLRSVESSFPLLYAIQQERDIAAGQRLAAEGAFDPTLRSRALDQGGTFSSARVDTFVEQATPFGGVTAFAGHRLGLGNFPVYAGGLKTAEGGELRAGITIPLLQNRATDPRRARLRAAQIAEQLADPTIRLARINFYRDSAAAYWLWQAAGGQYRVAQYLLKLAEDRQKFLDEQLRQGAPGVTEDVVTLNRRLVAERQEVLLTTERTLQEAALRLSLFLRDGAGEPLVPKAEWLLPAFIDLGAPLPSAAPEALASDVERALAQRPELVRFQLEKERRTVELQLATNQLLPQVNVFAAGTQDVGFSKKTFTGEGIFRTDRQTAEVGAFLEAPLPFRNARGLTATARAQLNQLLAQEKFQRDSIAAQVADAASALTQTYQRLDRAREELKQANRVLEQSTVRYRAGAITLVELNIQETAAAAARAKVVALVGAYYAAVANYLAALGLDAPAPGTGGAVLPVTEPLRQMQPPPKP